MPRTTLDRLVSWMALAAAAVLIAAGALLTWGHYFVGDQVRTQLAAQQIYFPAEGSAATAAPAFAQMRQYAGKQLLTGDEAHTYADHFIAVHLQEIGGGKTYAQLSAASQAAPTNAALAKTVQTVFQGETLRGLLLNAYAFGTMAMLAGIAAIGAFVAAALMLALGGLGLRHSRRVSPSQIILAPTRPVPTKVS